MSAEKEFVRVLKWILANAPKSSSKSIRERVDVVRRAVNDLDKTVRNVEASERQ